jgi:hypothetical protein
MRTLGTLIVVVWVLSMAGPALADESPFAIRFGITLVEPTTDTSFQGSVTEFDSNFGAEFDFEWYFLSRLGLEAGVMTSGDVDVTEDRDAIGAVTFSTLTVGLNGHVVRNDSIDWAIGVVVGQASYGDFDSSDGVTTFRSEEDTIWGVQTFLDIPINKGGAWAIDVGVKWVSTSLDPGSGPGLDYDPVILRVMGVWRWGTPR